MINGYGFLTIIVVCITIIVMYEQLQSRKKWEAYYKRPLPPGVKWLRPNGTREYSTQNEEARIKEDDDD
jgi:hypothetical protein